MLTSDGLLAGTPTTAARAAVRIRVTDARAAAYGVTTTFTVVVAAR